MKIRIKIQGASIFLSTVLVLLFPKFIFPFWKEAVHDRAFDAAGIALVLFGYLFRVLSRGYKEENTSGGNKLVKDGPYSLIRNPMYFGTMLIGSGVILVLLTLWATPFFILGYLLIYIPQIKREEEALLKRFGKEYSDYCKNVPRYLPKISGLLNLAKYFSIRLSWVKKEIQSFVVALALITGIEAWEDIRLFGYREFLKELLFLALIIALFVLALVLTRRKDKVSVAVK